MAELVDALDSKSSSFGSVGSIPTQGTVTIRNVFIDNELYFFIAHFVTYWQQTTSFFPKGLI